MDLWTVVSYASQQMHSPDIIATVLLITGIR